MPSQPATSTQPQCQQERLAGTSLLTQPSWHSCQEQAPAKFQSLSRCRLISPAFALSSSLLAIDFLSLFSLTRSFTSCCSNLCNSALIRTQIFFFFLLCSSGAEAIFRVWFSHPEFLSWSCRPAGMTPVHCTKLREQLSSSSPLAPCCFADMAAFWCVVLPGLITLKRLTPQPSY